MTLNHAKNETERTTSTPKSSRWWFLTISQEKMNRTELIAALEGINNAAYIGQLEQGKDGYQHWHVLLYREHAIRFRTVKEALPTAHIEPRKGSRAQAIGLCHQGRNPRGRRTTPRKGHHANRVPAGQKKRPGFTA